MPLSFQNKKMEHICDYFPVKPLLRFAQEHGDRKRSIHVMGYIDPSYTAAEQIPLINNVNICFDNELKACPLPKLFHY